MDPVTATPQAPQVLTQAALSKQGTFDAVKQWSLPKFMKEQGTKTAQIIRNPHTGKTFVSFGVGTNAALSHKITKLDGSETVSEMANGDFLVHVTTEQPDNVVSTFTL